MFGFEKKIHRKYIPKKPFFVFLTVLSLIYIFINFLYRGGQQTINKIRQEPSFVLSILEQSPLLQKISAFIVSKITHVNYSHIIDTFVHIEEISDYLGFRGEKKYLVILQNSSELRPNGGFYGSFGLIGMSGGKISSVSVEDSYVLPYLNSGVAIQIPQRARGIFDKNITFIAGNKFGLTSLDGRNIKMIFESTFPRTTIDGVVFVTTDAISALDLSFSQQILKWQFINAASDLIRGDSNPYKKEKYLKELSQEFEKKKYQLIKNGILHINRLQNNGLVNVYLYGASTGLNESVQQLGFSTNPSTGTIYAWDINHAENKIDGFLTKHTQYISKGGTYDGKDRVQLTGTAGTIAIGYAISIPNWYLGKVSEREKEFGIQLNEREQYILCTRRPTTDHYGMILLPLGREVSSYSGDFVQQPVQHLSPYGTYITYKRGGTGYVQNYSFLFEIRKTIASKP